MGKKAPRFAAAAVFLLTLAACGGGGTPTSQTDVGITSNSILLGNTIAQSGPAAAYGTIGNAELAYFTYVNNNQGGVNGRKITFKILDDAYNPAQTITQTKQLVESDQVFAMFSGLGTQAQTSVREYLNGKKVPQLFVATGATTFMKDFGSNQWTIGWQPPYQGEARIYAKDVLANHPNAKIGVLYQNDDYGQDYLKGLTDGLGDKASMIVAKQSYDVTAANPFPQLTQLKASGADTLFLFSTPKPSIQSLAFISAVHWEPTIYLNSVSNPQVYMGLAAKAGAALKNVTSGEPSSSHTSHQGPAALLAAGLPSGLHPGRSFRGQPDHGRLAAVPARRAHVPGPLPRRAQGAEGAARPGVDVRPGGHGVRDHGLAGVGRLPLPPAQRSPFRAAGPRHRLSLRPARGAGTCRPAPRPARRLLRPGGGRSLGCPRPDAAAAVHRPVRPPGRAVLSGLRVLPAALAPLAAVRGDLHHRQRARDLRHLVWQLVLDARRALDPHPVRQPAVGHRRRLRGHRRFGAGRALARLQAGLEHHHHQDHY